MKYGLIGEKLGHSFSKIIHESLSDYEYELCEIARGELDSFMKAKDFLGINVTIPYKEAVIPYLYHLEDSAREIGAVNTIVNRDGRLYGYNTDFYGMKMLFTHVGIDVNGKKAAVLGTGGTSKTARAVLELLGAPEILRVSRGGRDGAITYGELYESHADTEIIVNTTPVGMYPNIDGFAVDVSRFPALSGVIDAVYNPLRTTLVKSAGKIGISAEGGLFMLVAQAVRASEIFLNKEYPSETVDEIYDNIRREKENIVLIGMPASGKSTVGCMIAERLGRKFVDTDEMITERIKMPIKDFFTLYGEAAFRDIESDVIRELAGENSLVIATGGGAVLRKENIFTLKHNGKIYFIDRPLEKLIPTDTRPLASDKASIEARYNERYSIYCKSCDVSIDADCDAEALAQKILENF
nr:shikimate dehydrogenase [Oscillospiraceae bacterium]